jgi:hypothetical protein
MRIHVIDAILSRNDRRKTARTQSLCPQHATRISRHGHPVRLSAIGGNHSVQAPPPRSVAWSPSFTAGLGSNLNVRAAQSRFVRGRSTVNTRDRKHLLPHASSESLMPRCSLSRTAPITRVAVHCTRIPVVLGGSWMSCVPILQAASFTGQVYTQVTIFRAFSGRTLWIRESI